MTKSEQHKIDLVKKLLANAWKAIEDQEPHWDDLFFEGAAGHHDTPQTCSHSYCIKLRNNNDTSRDW